MSPLSIAPGRPGGGGGTGGGGGGGMSAAGVRRLLEAFGVQGGGGPPQPAPEPYSLILNMHASDPDLQWNRVEVSVPTLIWPYRDDDLTGTGDLDWIVVQYARRQVRQSMGFVPGSFSTQGPGIFPSARRGACLLWSPGVWWVRVVSGQTGGGRLGFNAVPNVDGSALSYFFFERTIGRGEVLFENSLPASGQKIVSAQEILECSAVFVEALNNFSHIRWERNPNGTGRFVRMGPGILSAILFEGASLPLADLWAEAQSGTTNIKWVLYR